MRAMNSNTQPQRVEVPGPSAAERFVLESCAARAAALGRTLAASRQLRREGCAPLDLASATTLEFLLLGVGIAAKQQLQLQQLMAAQYRSETLDRARRTQAEREARDATARFLGDGRAYTPR